MQRNVVGVVVVLVAAWATIWCAGSVAGTPPSGATRAVIGDCTTHGRLVHRHSATALRKALAHLPQDVREYSDCERIIRWALRHPGPDRVRAVFRDCADGALDQRFSQRTLHRALRHLPARLREYSQCERTIRRELRPLR